jgi:hypothetical protein
VRLQIGLTDLFGDDLVAIWLYGGQLAPGGSPGDVDLHVVVQREPDQDELSKIRSLHDTIRRDLKIDELDAWYVLLSEAMSSERPRDLNWHEEIRDENWALKRAHWFAGAYVVVHGDAPTELVPQPSWTEVESELIAQADRAGEEVAEGTQHPVALTMRLCRVLFTLATGEVVRSKRDAAQFAIEQLPAGSRSHVATAVRNYNGSPLENDVPFTREAMNDLYRDIRPLIDAARTGRR